MEKCAEEYFIMSDLPIADSMNYKTLNFSVMGDQDGSLVSLEENKNIPFAIRRVYYIYGTAANFIRGKHAHPRLQQVAVAVSGSCRFILDDGKQKKSITLDSPRIGLFIGENVWREMHDFSPDCVLMVLANDYYNEGEYIRNYKAFRQHLKSLEP